MHPFHSDARPTMFAFLMPAPTMAHTDLFIPIIYRTILAKVTLALTGQNIDLFQEHFKYQTKESKHN